MQLAVVVLSRKPLRVPVQRSAHRPPALVPLTNPNERRSRACSPAKAPPTLAGTRVGANLARARRRSRETHPGPPGLPMPRPSLGGRQWPDSSVTAANWPPVPTSPGGRQPTPKDRAALAPDGGTQAGGAARPSLPVHELRPGGSGCATQGEPRGPSSTLRTVLTAADPRDQSNAEPPLTPSPQ